MCTKAMYAKTTGEQESPGLAVGGPILNSGEYPTALATLVRADRAAHDVAQTTLREFRGEVDLYPEDR